jgi:hypothetical protein
MASTFVSKPAWKSDCVVSVRQAVSAAALSAKSWVVALPSLTTTLLAVPVVQPGKLALMRG